jgi:UDP-N-acetylglucosamine:LPS N-acetylglucosamine transferase
LLLTWEEELELFTASNPKLTTPSPKQKQPQNKTKQKTPTILAVGGSMGFNPQALESKKDVPKSKNVG